jgi:hypothetical protein
MRSEWNFGVPSIFPTCVTSRPPFNHIVGLRPTPTNLIVPKHVRNRRHIVRLRREWTKGMEWMSAGAMHCEACWPTDNTCVYPEAQPEQGAQMCHTLQSFRPPPNPSLTSVLEIFLHCTPPNSWSKESFPVFRNLAVKRIRRESQARWKKRGTTSKKRVIKRAVGRQRVKACLGELPGMRKLPSTGNLERSFDISFWGRNIADVGSK